MVAKSRMLRSEVSGCEGPTGVWFWEQPEVQVFVHVCDEGPFSRDPNEPSHPRVRAGEGTHTTFHRFTSGYGGNH